MTSRLHGQQVHFTCVSPRASTDHVVGICPFKAISGTTSLTHLSVTPRSHVTRRLTPASLRPYSLTHSLIRACSPVTLRAIDLIAFKISAAPRKNNVNGTTLLGLC